MPPSAAQKMMEELRRLSDYEIAKSYVGLAKEGRIAGVYARKANVIEQRITRSGQKLCLTLELRFQLASAIAGAAQIQVE